VGEDLSLKELLENTEVNEEDISVVESIPLAQLLQILDNARRVTCNDGLGLLLGVLLHPSTYGPIGGPPLTVQIWEMPSTCSVNSLLNRLLFTVAPHMY